MKPVGAPDVTIAAYHRGEEIDFAEAEDLAESPALDDLSDKSVDLTQRWVASSVTSASIATSWLKQHKTLATGTVVVCVVGLALLLVLIASLRVTTGDLVVEVNEPGANVEVLDAEGKVIVMGVSGDSPLTFSMEPGRHRMKVEKDGFVVHSEEVEIAAHGKTVVRAKLVPQSPDPGTLVLTVSEADARVQLLGEAGNVEATYRSSGTPLSVPLAAGKHRLVIEKSGFQSYTTDLTILTGAGTAITATLEKTASTTGTLVVKVNETDALVELLDMNAAVVGTYRASWAPT